jgi:hypothetical protein
VPGLVRALRCADHNMASLAREQTKRNTLLQYQYVAPMLYFGRFHDRLRQSLDQRSELREDLVTSERKEEEARTALLVLQSTDRSSEQPNVAQDELNAAQMELAMAEDRVESRRMELQRTALELKEDSERLLELQRRRVAVSTLLQMHTLCLF